jgi:hypothetical protein
VADPDLAILDASIHPWDHRFSRTRPLNFKMKKDVVPQEEKWIGTQIARMPVFKDKQADCS